jgi:hypothetical protein
MRLWKVRSAAGKYRAKRRSDQRKTARLPGKVVRASQKLAGRLPIFAGCPKFIPIQSKRAIKGPGNSADTL